MNRGRVARALEGTWRPEHLFALKQAFELYLFHQHQVTECDAMVAAELARLPARTEAAPTGLEAPQTRPQEQRPPLRRRRPACTGRWEWT